MAVRTPRQLPGYGQPAQQQQPAMSTTAGPISAAMGATQTRARPPGQPSTGAAAPAPTAGASANFPAGTGPISVPQMTTPNVMNPQSIMQSLTGYQNQANQANNERYNQGLGVLGTGQGTVRDLYGGATQDVQNVGNLAYNRINENLQKSQGSTQQNAISRGLTNTSALDQMQAANTRNAEFERQGVDEMRAKMFAGLKTQQAGAEQGMTNSIADFVGARNDTAPNTGEYAGLMQGAAAGGYGAKPAMRTGTVTNSPSPSFPPSNAGGGGSGGGGGGGWFDNATGASGGGGSSYVGGGGGGAFGASGYGTRGGAGPISQAVGGGSPDGTGGYAFMGNGSSVGSGLQPASSINQDPFNGGVDNGIAPDQKGSISIQPAGSPASGGTDASDLDGWNEYIKMLMAKKNAGG